MADAVSKAQAIIAGRARAIGWPVEEDGKTWRYRITRPDSVRVLLHRTPSDVNWEHVALRRLNGKDMAFDDALEKYRAKEERVRQKRLADDKAAAATATAKAAKVARQAAAVEHAAGPLAVVEFDPAWLLTPHDIFETRTGIMTPELAAKVRATVRPEKQRRRRPNRVQDFVNIIKANEWGCTHQGGAMDVDGTLQDAQHRMEAIELTGTPQVIQMSVGAPRENYTKLDTPLVRTARDALHARGEEHVTYLEQAARCVMMFDRYGSELISRRRSVKITVDAVDRFVTHAGDELRDAVAMALGIRREFKINAAALATAIYLIRRQVGARDRRVILFFGDMETGLNCTRNDPIYVLRRHINNRTAGTTRMFFVLGLIIKAWNARAVGRSVTTLALRSDEAFPSTIIVPPPSEE
jgi:hypothetical protein